MRTEEEIQDEIKELRKLAKQVGDLDAAELEASADALEWVLGKDEDEDEDEDD